MKRFGPMFLLMKKYKKFSLFWVFSIVECAVDVGGELHDHPVYIQTHIYSVYAGVNITYCVFRPPDIFP